MALSARNAAQKALKNESAARSAAQRSTAEAKRLARVALHATNEAQQAATATRTLAVLAQQQRKDAERTTYFADMKLIADAYEAKQYDRIGALLEETKQEKYRPYRGFEWGYWHRLRRLNYVTPKGHTGDLSTLALSLDGTRTVTANGDKALVVNDMQNDRQILTLKGRTDNLRSADFSPDGKWILTGGGKEGKSGEAIIWNAQTGQQVLKFTGDMLPVYLVQYSRVDWIAAHLPDTQPDDNGVIASEVSPTEDQLDRIEGLAYYLGRIAQTGEIAAHIATLALKVWNDLHKANPSLPVPDAAPGPDQQLLYTWNRGKHHLELEIFPAEPAEFFYLNRTTNISWEESYVIGSTLSDTTLKHLQYVV